jgi:hypothetical protein
MLHSRRGVVLLIVVATLTVLPWTAEASPFCPVLQTSPFVSAFASLREEVGAAMGQPIECAHADGTTGDAHQQTSTGIAVFKQDGDVAIFTNGREFWRLTPAGLAYWEGWHGHAGPPNESETGPIATVPLSTTSVEPYPKVEAVTIAQVLDGESRHMVLQHGGTSYAVEVDSACSDDQPLLGRVIFVISKEDFAERGSRLILRIRGRECVVMASQPL